MFSLFEKIFDKLALTLNFLNRDRSPSNRIKVKHSTVGSLQQAMGSITNVTNYPSETISDLERKILNRLYRDFRANSQLVHWGIQEMYREFGITDGTYVGMLHDSKFIKADSDEYLTLTTDGVRYMDAHVSQGRPRIDLKDGLSVSGGHNGNHIIFQVKNNGKNTAVNLEFYLSADGIQTDPQVIKEKLIAGQESSLVSYRYTDTPFFKSKVENGKIIFTYKDSGGFSFLSGQSITQDNRDDGNWNLHGGSGKYFEA